MGKDSRYGLTLSKHDQGIATMNFCKLGFIFVRLFVFGFIINSLGCCHCCDRPRLFPNLFASRYSDPYATHLSGSSYVGSTMNFSGGSSPSCGCATGMVNGPELPMPNTNPPGSENLNQPSQNPNNNPPNVIPRIEENQAPQKEINPNSTSRRIIR